MTAAGKTNVVCERARHNLHACREPVRDVVRVVRRSEPRDEVAAPGGSSGQPLVVLTIQREDRGAKPPGDVMGR